MIFGLLRTRRLPVPTWKGWLLLVACGVAAMWWFANHIHAFLAQNNPLPNADVLLVEGWVTDECIHVAKREFEESRCRWVCTTGVTMNRGEFMSEYRTWAQLTAARLIAAGIPRERIIVAPGKDTQRRRTFNGMLAARETLEGEGLDIKTVNVLTQGTHSRRTGMVARRVFGDAIAIGVKVVEDPSYDPKYWWGSSSGFKDVVMESISCIYECVNGGES